MATFRYECIANDGTAASGSISAPDRASAIRDLQARGLHPVDVQETGRRAARADSRSHVSSSEPSGLAALLGRRSRPTLSRVELSNFIREIATALEAGLPLVQSLRTVRRQASGKAMPVILDFLIEKVEAGMPLYQACAEYGPPFDDMAVGMIRASDASGRMAEVLHQLADLLDRSVELRREIMGATIYPLVVVVAIAASVVVLVTFVLPRLLEPIAGNASFEMPWPTAVLLAMADFIGTWWWAILISIAAVLIAWRAWIRIPANRERFDGFVLRVPLIKRLVRDIAVARFTRTLGTLVSAGIPILSALKIVRDTLGNRVLMRAIDDVQEKVTTGQSLADPLERCGHFPPLLVQIVNIGERSGKLETMLLHASGSFDRQVNQSLKLVSTLLPPVLLVVMAGLVVFVLIAILLPLLEMQSAFGG